MTQKQKFFLLAIVILAMFFRFYRIVQMPGGLFPDMAANGLDINLMQQGHIQPFYERGNGREALFFFMEWGSVALFGKGVWQFSIVSAFMGVLAVLMCFVVTRKIFSFEIDPADPDARKKNSRATNIALLASFLMAVSSWHTVLSRTAFRATLIPLFTSLVFYFILETANAQGLKKRLTASFLAGVFFAGGFYTYIAFRIMLPVLGVLIGWPLLVDIFRSPRFLRIKKYWKPFVVFVLGFLIFIYPLANYFVHNPKSFVGRAGNVSVFNQELYTVDGVQLHEKPPVPIVFSVIGEVTKQQLLGFFVHGDLNWRHNISGYPFLSPLVSPFFGAGLAAATLLAAAYILMPRKNKSWWKYALLAGWFWGMLLPVVTTAEGIPHGLRGVGDIPVVFIVSALAIYFLWEKVYAFHLKLNCVVPDKPQWQALAETSLNVKNPHEGKPYLGFKLVNFAFKILVATFCLALVLQTYFLYFVQAYNSPENFYFFRSDLTRVSEYLKQQCDKQHVYLVLDEFWLQTTDYLTSDSKGNFSDPCNVPYQKVEPADAWKLPSLKKGDQVVFTQSTVFDAKKFKEHHPEARLLLEDRNKFGQANMAVYTAK